MKFTFEVTVTVPPGGSELLEVHGTPAEYNAVYCCSTRQEGTE